MLWCLIIHICSLFVIPVRNRLPIHCLANHTHKQCSSHSFYFLKFIYFYLYIFDCIGSLLLHAGFLQLLGVGATLPCGAWASYSSGFSCCRAWALGMWALVGVARGLSSCGTQAQVLCGMWDLPGTGLEPVYPALAGRFLTAVPPGKPLFVLYFSSFSFFSFYSF